MSITQIVTDRQPHRVSDRDNGYVSLDKTLEWLAERTEFVDPEFGRRKKLSWNVAAAKPHASIPPTIFYKWID